VANRIERNHGWCSLRRVMDIRRLTALVCAGLVTVGWGGCSRLGFNDGVAATVSTGRALVPSRPPPGVVLDVVNRRGRGGQPQGMMRVYGRGRLDTRARAVDEPLIIVSYQPSSDLGLYLPGSGTSSGVAWVTWDLPTSTEHAPQGAVIGRGFELAELNRVVQGVKGGERERDLRATVLPSGFHEIAAGRFSLAAFMDSNPPYPSAQLRWRGPSRGFVLLSAVAHNDALTFLSRVAVDDDRGTRIRGQLGAHGRLIVPSPVGLTPTMWTWTEDNLDIVVTAVNISDDTVEKLIASLHRGNDAEWRRLGSETA
jgi:hypothetical protein